MKPFHLLEQDDQKDMQHDIFGHVMLMASASCNANGLIYGTTAFL